MAVNSKLGSSTSATSPCALNQKHKEKEICNIAKVSLGMQDDIVEVTNALVSKRKRKGREEVTTNWEGDWKSKYKDYDYWMQVTVPPGADKDASKTGDLKAKISLSADSFCSASSCGHKGQKEVNKIEIEEWGWNDSSKEPATAEFIVKCPESPLDDTDSLSWHELFKLVTSEYGETAVVYYITSKLCGKSNTKESFSEVKGLLQVFPEKKIEITIKLNKLLSISLTKESNGDQKKEITKFSNATSLSRDENGISGYSSSNRSTFSSKALSKERDKKIESKANGEDSFVDIVFKVDGNEITALKTIQKYLDTFREAKEVIEGVTSFLGSMPKVGLFYELSLKGLEGEIGLTSELIRDEQRSNGTCLFLKEDYSLNFNLMILEFMGSIGFGIKYDSTGTFIGDLWSIGSSGELLKLDASVSLTVKITCSVEAQLGKEELSSEPYEYGSGKIEASLIPKLSFILVIAGHNNGGQATADLSAEGKVSIRKNANGYFDFETKAMGYLIYHYEHGELVVDWEGEWKATKKVICKDKKLWGK